MSAIIFRDASHLASIELHRIKLALAIVVLVGGEIQRAARFANSLYLEDLKIATGELPDQLCRHAGGTPSIEAVKIEMSVAIAPARP